MNNDTDIELAPDYDTPPDYETPPHSPSSDGDLENYENRYEEYIDRIQKQQIDEIIVYSDNILSSNFLDFLTYLFYFDIEQLYMNAGLITIICSCIVKNTFNKYLLLLYILFQFFVTFLRSYVYSSYLDSDMFSPSIVLYIFFIFSQIYINFYICYFYYLIHRLRHINIRTVLEDHL